MAERYGREAVAVEATLDRSVAPIPSFARRRLRVWTRRYVVDAPLERVFDTYVTSHPADTWPRRLVRFWAARAPDGRPVLSSDPWPTTAVGTKLCCGLRMLTPTDAFNVWTGVEVTDVQPRRSLRYEYLEGSTTAGANDVRFEASGRQTVVTHRSEYCGATRLEHAFIPLLEARFHGGFVDGMHAGVKRVCERAVASEP